MAVKPPRACFIDFPIGAPIGKPYQPELQRAVLRAIFAQTPRFAADWAMHELPFQYFKDGSRAWEEELKELYRGGLGTVSAHVADHGKRGESLLGNEKVFALRCNC